MFHVKQSQSEEHFVRMMNVRGIFCLVYMDSRFCLSWFRL